MQRSGVGEDLSHDHRRNSVLFRNLVSTMTGRPSGLMASKSTYPLPRSTSRPRTISRGEPLNGRSSGAAATRSCNVFSSGKPVGLSSVHSRAGLSCQIAVMHGLSFCIDGHGSASLTMPFAPVVYDDFMSIMFGYYPWPNLCRPSPHPSRRPVVRGQLSEAFGSAAAMLNELADDRVPQGLHPRPLRRQRAGRVKVLDDFAPALQIGARGG